MEGKTLEIEITTNILCDIFGTRNKITVPYAVSSRLRTLLEIWNSTHRNKVLERLLDGENLKPEIIFLVNGTSLESLNGLETEIRDGDQLVILTAMTGG